MNPSSSRFGRRGRAPEFRGLALASLLGLLASASSAQAVDTLVPRLAGLPWASGVNGALSENAGFGGWRGRVTDVRTIFLGSTTNRGAAR